jgi:putative ABC transport system ATP-binding protein
MGDVRVPVLHDVDLQVERGELVVIVGPSGSGKSTLINIIGGIDSVTNGRVWFGSSELSRFDERALTRYRRESVGFIFQFYNLVPTLTARENVTVAAELVEDPIDPDEALHLVGLDDRRDHFPAQLSGGEQQRVAIARAVAKRPELLLCDEPTGALDLRTGRKVLGALQHLNETMQMTIIIITHNSAIAHIADSVVHLGEGTIAHIERNEAPASASEISW